MSKKSNDIELVPVELSLDTSQNQPQEPTEQIRVKFNVTLREEPKAPVQALYRVLVAHTPDNYLTSIIRAKLIEDGFTHTSIETLHGETLIFAGTFYNKQKAINMISRLEVLGYKPKVI